MRKPGGTEPVLRRMQYALLPDSDPFNRPQRQLSLLSIILIGGGLLLVVIVNLVYLQFR
jgi:hypothetical protein